MIRSRMRSVASRKARFEILEDRRLLSLVDGVIGEIDNVEICDVAIVEPDISYVVTDDAIQVPGFSPNPAYHELFCDVSSDGQYMFLIQDHYPSYKVTSRRKDLQTGQWGSPEVLFPSAASPAPSIASHPSLGPNRLVTDGTTLFFVGWNAEIWYSTRSADEWSSAEKADNLTGISPFFTGEKLYVTNYVNNRYEIQVSEYHDGIFDPPTKVDLGGDGHDQDAWISQDGNQMIFSSTRSGGEGGWDLYSATWSGSDWTDVTNLGAHVNTSADEQMGRIAEDAGLLFFIRGYPWETLQAPVSCAPTADPTPLTIIVHGFRLWGGFPDWVYDMGMSIGEKARPGCTEEQVFNSRVELVNNGSLEAPLYEPISFDVPDNSCESLLLFDWTILSTAFGSADSDEVADNLARLVSNRLPEVGQRDVHFIGQSRGAFVILSAIRQLEDKDARIGHLQMTTLDPQPWGPDGVLGVPSHVDFADNYYQRTGDSIVKGEAVPDALNVNLTEQLKEWPGRSDHSQVHDWYHWTIDLSDDGSPSPKLWEFDVPRLDDQRETSSRSSLYPNPAWEEGAKVGYDWSVVGGGHESRPQRLPGASLNGVYVTVDTPAGTGEAQVHVVENPSPGDAPPQVEEFPIGFCQLSVNEIDPGETSTLTIYLPPDVSVNSYYKFGPRPGNPDSHWFEFRFDGTTGAEFIGNVVYVQYVDGQRGDDDLTENGQISDPGGPAVLAGMSLHGGVLQIIGTNQNDRVSLQSVQHGDLMVYTDFLDGPRFERFDAAQVEQIDVRLYGGEDRVSVSRSVNTPVSIEGGRGNDFIHGGSGNDALLGGRGNDFLQGWDGDDRLEGGPGSDRLFGGFGDDWLDGGDGEDRAFGSWGNDMLLGGDGRDSLYGSFGRDLLIGGQGADRLYGGFGDDILIGGTTSYDANDEALVAIMAEWTASGSIDTRIGRLKNGGGLNGTFLLNDENVFDDEEEDVLHGGPGSDWFLFFDLDSVRGRSRQDR